MHTSLILLLFFLKIKLFPTTKENDNYLKENQKKSRSRSRESDKKKHRKKSSSPSDEESSGKRTPNFGKKTPIKNLKKKYYSDKNELNELEEYSFLTESLKKNIDINTEEKNRRKESEEILKEMIEKNK